MLRRAHLPAGAVFAALLGFVSSAHADAIDGNWCRDDGMRMSIDGPAIVTPGGRKITGDYSRHAFSYVVPGGEPGAGATVAIQLLNEHLAHARQGSGPVEEWRRCARGVS